VAVTAEVELALHGAVGVVTVGHAVVALLIGVEGAVTAKDTGSPEVEEPALVSVVLVPGGPSVVVGVAPDPPGPLVGDPGPLESPVEDPLPRFGPSLGDTSLQPPRSASSEAQRMRGMRREAW